MEFDEQGAVIGLELLNVRDTLERAGKLTLTWPPAELQRGDLGALLVAA